MYIYREKKRKVSVIPTQSAAPRTTNPVGNIGGDHVPVVISARLNGKMDTSEQFCPDYIYCGQTLPEERRADIGYIVDANRWDGSEGTYPAFSHKQLMELHFSQAERGNSSSLLI